MDRSSMIGALLVALFGIVLLSACGGSTAALPTPMGAAAGFPTFFYFYTDN